MFSIRDDYTSQIYGIVVHIDMYIYSLQVANMNLHFTNVKRNLNNYYNVNKLSTQNVYHVNQNSRIFKSLCTPLLYFFSSTVFRKVSQSTAWLIDIN